MRGVGMPNRGSAARGIALGLRVAALLLRAALRAKEKGRAGRPLSNP